MKTVSILAATCVAAMCGVAPAFADPISDIVAEAAAPAESQAQAKGRTALAEDRLSELAAGDTNTYNVVAGQQLSATAQGNTINGDVDTGQVVIEAGAFSNFNGVGNIVSNTGANSNLNGSIMVNIVGASPVDF